MLFLKQPCILPFLFHKSATTCHSDSNKVSNSKLKPDLRNCFKPEVIESTSPPQQPHKWGTFLDTLFVHSEAQKSVIYVFSWLQNFIPSNPNCQGVDGIVAAYYNCVSNCTLFGKYPARSVNIPFGLASRNILSFSRGQLKLNFVLLLRYYTSFIFRWPWETKFKSELIFRISGPTNFAPVINNTARYVLFCYQMT